jgi:hypothetical protein
VLDCLPKVANATAAKPAGREDPAFATINLSLTM